MRRKAGAVFVEGEVLVTTAGGAGKCAGWIAAVAVIFLLSTEQRWLHELREYCRHYLIGTYCPIHWLDWAERLSRNRLLKWQTVCFGSVLPEVPFCRLLSFL